jgi:hypothetical protein
MNADEKDMERINPELQPRSSFSLAADGRRYTPIIKSRNSKESDEPPM